METFQNVIRRVQRKARELALEDAGDAGAVAKQEQPRRNDAGAATRSPRASGSRVDVLDAADAYLGWEQDLCSEYSVILNPKSGKEKQSFQCELWDVWLPSWSQAPGADVLLQRRKLSPCGEEQQSSRHEVVPMYGLRMGKIP